MHTLKFRHYIDSAHQLTDSPALATKKCANLHGHTYAIDVEIGASKLDGAGMVIDFTTIKERLDVLDHKYINDVFEQLGFDEESTAENIATFYLEMLSTEFPKLHIASVAVKEGYKGEDKGGWVIATHNND